MIRRLAALAAVATLAITGLTATPAQAAPVTCVPTNCGPSPWGQIRLYDGATWTGNWSSASGGTVLGTCINLPHPATASSIANNTHIEWRAYAYDNCPSPFPLAVIWPHTANDSIGAPVSNSIRSIVAVSNDSPN